MAGREASVTSRLNVAIRRIESGVRSPSDALAFTEMIGIKAFRLLREREFARCLGYVTEVFTGRNLYFEAVARRSGRELVEVDVQGSRMCLDPTDPGISKTLLSYGVHEQHSTDAFGAELERLARTVDGEITVVEIGANIGYFCLLEARSLGERARIFALEPVPENADMLERNVRLNGYEGRISVERRAVGDRVGTAELRLSDLSNQHTLRMPTETDAGPPTSANSIEVPVTTVPKFLAERGVAPDEVNVLRMDLEGYEATVFEQLDEILAAPGPTLLYVEFHPLFLSSEEIRSIGAALRENGFRVASAAVHESAVGIEGQKRWHGKPLEVSDPDRPDRLLREVDHSLELVVEKPAPTGES